MNSKYPVILGAIAAIVAIGIATGHNMWMWIVLYWSVLTVKNISDYTKENRNETK